MFVKRSNGGNGRDRIFAAWAAVGVFVFTVAILVSNYAWQDYQRGIGEAETETRHAAAILSEQVGRTLGEVMLLSDSLRQDLGFARRLPFSVTNDNLQLILDEKFLRLPQLEAIAVLDAGRNALLTAGDWEKSSDAALEQGILERLRNGSNENVILTRPFKIAGDGHWRIALIQRLANAGGQFDGAIVAVLDPVYLHDDFTAKAASTRVGLSFLQAGPVVLAQGQAGREAGGVFKNDDRLFPQELMTGQGGTFEGALSGMTVPWIASYRRLPQGNLIIGAAITKQDVIDAWLRRRAPDLLIGGLSVLVIVMLIVYAMCQIGHRVRAEGAAQKAETHLSDGIEGLSEGFVLFDGNDRLVLCNSRLGEIYPDVADILHPGTARSDLLKTAVERGIYADVRSTGSMQWTDERIRESRQRHGLSEHLLDPVAGFRCLSTGHATAGRSPYTPT